MQRPTYLFVLVTLLGVVKPAGAGLIQNGGFETGNFSGWTVTDRPGLRFGKWSVSNSAVSPLSASATPGQAGGTYYALTDQTNPGAHALTQTFAVAPGSIVKLSFDMFINDHGLGPRYAGGAQDLDYTTIEPNQHARVDILTAGASAFDTGTGVVQNLYRSSLQAPATGSNPWVHYDLDITAAVGGGGTFQLRFAEVDNVLYLQQGVDNVSITAVSAVPEPSSLVLLAAAVTAGCYFGRRRNLPSAG